MIENLDKESFEIFRLYSADSYSDPQMPYILSNDCIFSVGWTVETLMHRHRSQLYNPNIANCFFRAGYVETWGRGIEKICEASKLHGVTRTEYKLHMEDIMVKFTPLKQDKVPKEQNGTLEEKY